MLRQELIEIVARNFELNSSDIEALGDNNSLNEFGLDSLTMISILMDIEEKYQFEIETEEFAIENFDTINKLLYLIQRKSNTTLSRSDAWDLVGSKFWEIGRESARPNKEDIDKLLVGIEPCQKLAIIGASTRFLIEEAVKRKICVTVYDFSNVMLKDLKNSIGNVCDYQNIDILKPLPYKLVGKHDFVLSERLINRFTRTEAITVYKNMNRLLCDSGELRNAIKLGLYNMDKKILKYAEDNNLSNDFYNEKTKTINYVKAASILPNCIVAHGEIPKDTLLNWYLGRGQESRYNYSDIIEIISKTGELLDTNELSTAENIVLFRSVKKKNVWDNGCYE